MSRTSVIAVSKIAVFGFFLLISSRVIELAQYRLHVGFRPTLAYFAIACLASFCMLATVRKAHFNELEGTKIYFVLLAILTALLIVTYRGESSQSEYSRLVLNDFYRPSAISYVIWPILNLCTGLFFYIIAQQKELRRAVIASVAAGLLIQVFSMEFDLWMPGVLGDANGRAGGLARNANGAAFLLIMLVCFFFPARIPDALSKTNINMMTTALFAVVFSQSRTGLFCCAVVSIVFLIVYRRRRLAMPSPTLLLILFGLSAANLFFSPALTGSIDESKTIEASQLVAPEQSQLAAPKQEDSSTPPAKEARSDASAKSLNEQKIKPSVDWDKVNASADKGNASADKMSDNSFLRRLKSRLSFDDSANLRLGAIAFFVKLAVTNPLGLGTGYTNKFMTGPHNTFVKIAVDNGVLGVVLYTCILGAIMWIAVRNRSPMLMALGCVCIIMSCVSHTVFVEPQMVVFFSTAMGVVVNARRPDAAGIGADSV